jgi:hypothetical protein
MFAAATRRHVNPVQLELVRTSVLVVLAVLAIIVALPTILSLAGGPLN